MSISISCDCGKELKIKDGLAGKKIRCPECQEILNVPAAESEEAEIPVPKKASSKSPAAGIAKVKRQVVEQNDDDDEEERPSRKNNKKKKSKKQPSNNLPMILGIGGGAVVVIGIIVAVVLISLSGTKKTESVAVNQNKPGLANPQSPNGAPHSPNGAPSPTASSASLVKTLTGHSKLVKKVMFTKDGKHIVTGSDDSIKLWDIAAGKDLYSIEPGMLGLTFLVIAPDERFLAAGGYQPAVRNGSTGVLIKNLEEDLGNIADGSLSQDGKLMAVVGTGYADRPVVVWDTQSWKVVHKFVHPPLSKQQPTAHQETRAALFDADAKILVVGISHAIIDGGDGTGTIAIYDLETDKPKLVKTPTPVEKLALHPTKKIAVGVNWQESQISVWDLEQAKLVRKIDVHAKDQISWLTFNRSGTALLCCSLDGSARLWNVETGKEIGVIIPNGEPINGAAFSDDGRFVALGVGTNVTIWDVSNLVK